MIIWVKKHGVCMINLLRICSKLIILNIKTIPYSHVKIIPQYFHLILQEMMKLDFAIHLSHSYLLHCQESAK